MNKKNMNKHPNQNNFKNNITILIPDMIDNVTKDSKSSKYPIYPLHIC